MTNSTDLAIDISKHSHEIFQSIPAMCFLYVCSEICFYTFGPIDWVGCRLVGEEDGRGCDSLPFDQIMEQKKIVWKTYFFYFSEERVPLSFLAGPAGTLDLWP